MFTKTGALLVKEAAENVPALVQTATKEGAWQKIKNAGGKVNRYAMPAMLGLTYAHGLTSGNMSVGEVAGDAAAWAGTDYAMNRTGKWLANNPASKLSKAVNFLPGWMRGVGKFAIPIATSIAGGMIGNKIAPWKRKPQTPQEYMQRNNIGE